MIRPLPVVLALAVLLTGACTVTDDPDGTAPTTKGSGPAVTQFRREHAVRFDLTAPRSAQDLGVPVGRDSAIFDRDDTTFWKVDFTLPEGRHFTHDTVIAVGVDTTHVPRSAVPDIVTVNAVAADLGQLAAQLQTAVDQLGLDPADVEAFLQEARRPLTAAQPDHTSFLSGKPIGFLTPTVEPRVVQGDDTIAVNYTFTWEHPASTP